MLDHSRVRPALAAAGDKLPPPLAIGVRVPKTPLSPPEAPLAPRLSPAEGKRGLFALPSLALSPPSAVPRLPSLLQPPSSAVTSPASMVSPSSATSTNMSRTHSTNATSPSTSAAAMTNMSMTNMSNMSTTTTVTTSSVPTSDLAARLALLLHARECCRGGAGCLVNNCQVARGVLDHCQECFLADGDCHVSCAQAKHLLRHFRVCRARGFPSTCRLCAQLRADFPWALRHVDSLSPVYLRHSAPDLGQDAAMVGAGAPAPLCRVVSDDSEVYRGNSRRRAVKRSRRTP